MPDIDGVNLRITADASSAEKELEDVSRSMAKLENEVLKRKVQLNVAPLTNAFKNTFSSLDTLGKSLENTFGKALKGIAAAVTAVSGAIGITVRNALSIGGGFEAQMTNVKIISAATTDELNALIKKAREMGATLPITAKDAAQAMELLAQRGTKAKDILATVADVSALAISQQIDMATSADLLGTTMTNFGLSVNDASKITDIFNNASNQSALNISKLVAAMKYVGPAAGALELPLEKVVAAMEAGANAGLTGEMIGTGLAMTMTRLASNSHILGVATHNLDGSLRDMSEIFADLAKAGMTAADANNIFGQRAGKMAIALLKQSASLVTYEKNIQKWGATQTAVQEKMKAWPNVWNAFKSATEELHIEIFDQIKDQSKEAVSSVANLTRVFSDWVGQTQIAGKSLTGFLQGLGFNIPSVSNFRKILDSLNIDVFVKKIKNFGAGIKGIADSIVGFFKSVKGPLAFLIEHLSALAQISFWGWIIGKGLQIPAAILNIAAAFKTLGINLSLIVTTPFGALIASLSAIAAGAVYAINKIKELDQIKLDKKKIEREIKEANFETEVDIQFNIKTGFEELSDAWEKADEGTREWAKNQRVLAQDNFINAYREAVEYVKKNKPEYAEALGKMGDKVNEVILKQMSNFLHGSIEDFKALPEYLKPVAERLNDTFYISNDNSLEIRRMRDELERVRMLQKEANEEAEKLKKKTKFDFISEDITSGLKNVLKNLPAQIKEAQKLLKGQHLEIAVGATVDEANKKIQELIEKISKKRNIPEAVIEEAVYADIAKLAEQGDKAAQLIMQQSGKAAEKVNEFLSKTRDYVDYLGVSPNKILPALNSMLNGVKKIDETTGKVTEEFKSLYNEAKRLTSLSFGRILDMRKAIEKGFGKSSDLEKEFETTLAQVSVKVKAEMEPTREDYRNERDYYNVFASKVVDEMFNLGGDIFGDKLTQKYAGMTGEAMGRALVTRVNKDFKDEVVMKVDGVDKLNDFAIDTQQIKDVFNPFAQEIQNVDFKAPVQEITSAINSFNNKISNISVNVPTQDFSNAFNPVISKLNNLEVKINSQEFVQAVNSLISKLDNIQIKAVSQELQNNINVSIDTQQINSSLEAFATRLENIDLQVQGQTQIKDYSEIILQVITEIRTLNSSVGAVENAVRAINISVPASNNEAVNIDLSSVISAIQNNSNLSSQIISAINGLNIPGETNNYNIDIQQTGFNIQRKSDADSLARSTAAAIQVGLGNGGV